MPHVHLWNATILLSLTTTISAKTISRGVTKSCASTVPEVLVKPVSWMSPHLLCGTLSFLCAQHAARQGQCLWHVGSAPMLCNAQSELPESRLDKPAVLKKQQQPPHLPLLGDRRRLRAVVEGHHEEQELLRHPLLRCSRVQTSQCPQWAPRTAASPSIGTHAQRVVIV